MNILFKEHHKLLVKLLEARVNFMVVGGYAVNYYGYNRSTGDIDLWIKPDNTNRDKLLEILTGFGFDKTGIKKLRHTDFQKTFVFSIWEKPYKVDFLTHISGVDFGDADSRKVIGNFQGLSLPFINLQDLIISKITTTRLRDKADVEELQKIKNSSL